MAGIQKSAGQIREAARASMQGKTGKCIGVTVLYFVIVMGMNAIPVLGTIASIVLSGPLTLGLTMFFLGIVRGESVGIERLFDGFNHVMNAFVTYILVAVFIILWSLLLIIPGLIKGLAYSMTFYILADNPEMKPLQAIEESRKMMDGNKLDLFILFLTFIGWYLLGVITLGLGFLWVIPYQNASLAHFYLEVNKGKNSVASAA
ncbi:MAG: DUF975 family protein [Chitinivibrionales bacterium]